MGLGPQADKLIDAPDLERERTSPTGSWDDAHAL